MNSSNTVSDSALSSLLQVATFHRIPADGESLSHEFKPADGKMQSGDLVRAARSLGFRSKSTKLDWSRLGYTPMPALCLLRTGEWAVLANFGRHASSDTPIGLLIDAAGKHHYKSEEELRSQLEGTIVVLQPREQVTATPGSFNLAWFMPQIVKHRLQVYKILLVSFCVSLLGLAAPICFQVVMDKVLVNRAVETNLTIYIMFAAAVGLEVSLGFLRGYLTAHLGCRLDVHLNSKVFAQLVRQPMQFFQARQVGEIAQRLRELEAVRSFLVNGLVTVGLDCLFIVVYLAVMWHYSSVLTQVVLVCLGIYIIIAFALGPVIRRRVRRQYENAARNQSFIVETVKAVRTVKSAALEPQMERNWEQKVSEYSKSTMHASMAGLWGSNSIQIVSQQSVALLLFLGAGEVIAGSMTVGALVAFNMLSSRVVQPVLRLSQMWQELQQVHVAIARVSDIMDAPTEQKTGGIQPERRLSGRIEFLEVTYRYPNKERDVLREINLEVQPGQIVAVVGGSGSGKSTLLALLQRLYLPSAGRIMVDGHDLSTLSLSWLRRQFGVVLQDNELFNGTVRDNIAYTDPTMDIEQVVKAAQLAGAHDFITNELGQGYQSLVGESGSQLSGGQRQRVAIARALASNPRVLLLDEATSALDSESTAIFQNNLSEICSGRTVFMITHNLTLLANCNLAVFMEAGRIVEIGTPRELLAKGGRYAEMYEKGRL